ncbi:MAG: DUF1365 domain-containing protein [Planctomycetes bacterium]|nr:DUF1365 domain-containing protein [Planctomycetota bacterium]
MQSCVYLGEVRHKRYAPGVHRFRYRLYMLYLDLEELPALARAGLVRSARFAPVSFRRDDHVIGSRSRQTLADAVLDLVQEESGRRPAGPVRLLTLLRCFGYYFSPLNLYYCFEPRGEAVEAVVAEVSNTPWRETHYYVLGDHNRTGPPGTLRFRHRKSFHVSPFLDMDLDYDWRLSRPDSRLAVHIVNRREGAPAFAAGLTLQRRELNRVQLLRLLARHPWMTARVVQAIYWQAFRLWRKRCPFVAHPKHAGQDAPTGPGAP